MKKELPYFYIGSSYGGQQGWFHDFWMREGGCAAVTACDVSIYLAREKGRTHLYPFNERNLSKADFLRFGEMMRPYLRPRHHGIDRLDIYIDGFGQYLRDEGEEGIGLAPFSGEESVAAARKAIKGRIDAGFPIPCLVLHHKARELHDYVWHWFILAGYEEEGGHFLVQAVSYGVGYWFDLAVLWDTGYQRKGGLVLVGDSDARA